MRIITWNVNSVRARLDRLLGVLERHEPDAICLQELKMAEEAFPALRLEQAGYHSAIFGQKTYNGVAILSKVPPGNVTRSFEDSGDDSQARLIAADVAGVRMISIYVPNGGDVTSDKWSYKLEWLSRLHEYLEAKTDPEKPLAVCGDFNITSDDKDVKQPELWAETVLCHHEARSAFDRLIDWGLVDAFRVVHPEGGIYSWWDYRRLGFHKNNGLRIDGVLVSKPLAERIQGAFVDRDERKGSKPSDHAPVILDFSD